MAIVYDRLTDGRRDKWLDGPTEQLTNLVTYKVALRRLKKHLLHDRAPNWADLWTDQWTNVWPDRNAYHRDTSSENCLRDV